ncbi:hypothetical protein [Streptomyces sp. NPDC001985]|uniref:hypothetical protein n=1 Tax=Streptomyces sp. NPDC001985 TaxID=3154406 RepID=UPI0033235F0A
MPTHTSLYLPPAAARAFAEIIETRAEQGSSSPAERPTPRGGPTAVPDCPDCLGTGTVGAREAQLCDCVSRQYEARAAARASGLAQHNPQIDVGFEFAGGRPEEYVTMTAVPLPGEEILWSDTYEDAEGNGWEDTQTYVVRDRRWTIGPATRPGQTQPHVLLSLTMAPSIGDAPRPG